MMLMATTTVRLPEGLKAESEALAASLGISMTALMAVALRDYLDRPVTRWSGAPSAPPSAPARVPALRPRAAPAAASAAVAAPAPARPLIKPPRSRADPCPCGAVDVMDRRLKYKHCHGKGV